VSFWCLMWLHGTLKKSSWTFVESCADAHLYIATHGSEIAILKIPTLRSHMFALLQLMQVHISIASSIICLPCHRIVANRKSCVIVWKGCVLSGICIKVYSSNASSKTYSQTAADLYKNWSKGSTEWPRNVSLEWRQGNSV